MSQSQSNQPLQPKQSNAGGDEVTFGNSSYLAKGTYNSASLQLTIEFKTGASRVYWPVYQQVWQAMKESPSPGSFYSRGVKGKFQTVSVFSPLKSTDLPKRGPK